MCRPKPTYSLDKSLGHLASRFSRLVLRRLNDEFIKNDLAVTSEQYSLLVQLWEHNGLAQGALAEKTAKDKTTMARLAATLETRGLIERRVSGQDGRERLLFLTEAGETLMGRATALAKNIQAEALEGIADEQLEACREVLRRAYANLRGAEMSRHGRGGR